MTGTPLSKTIFIASLLVLAFTKAVPISREIRISNGATTFTSSTAIGTFTDITVTTTSAAAGGAAAENIGAIQFNAPFIKRLLGEMYYAWKFGVD